ncbi:hypothetical protein A2691_02315 [Candidatus Woesebacteria bacterium RIFCSPHIGHO2_01_FULL_39_23]|uniref:Uncharacterized protein n=1 Tax=candidate division WWE3 bacterium RIFCSPLOWO2_01_FULL_37_15 TaxID=1802622 RepID=A0A1F4UXK0_UNCKA|nr:MAG: hypothetical protein A3A69_00085 [candidate division WWE3 bacterium RIFCSPLOWO2_01_FULL_37_15]OGM22685.1 MAG: hypothetical protein A2691_02315 [Candidatus Woesebacteria bacterium RIFCSPHIGHO2_01_FULL_39_23]
MKDLFVYTLVKAVAPQVVESMISKIKVYRSIILKLPENTNQINLKNKLSQIGQTEKLWHLIDNSDPSNFPIITGDTKLSTQISENEFYIAFFNDKPSFWNPNWPQITIVVLKELSPTDKYIVISSYFLRPQIAERGILTKNCNIVLETVFNYYKSQGVDISENIRSSKVLIDPITSHNKNISPILAILVIIGFILLLLGAWALIIKFKLI